MSVFPGGVVDEIKANLTTNFVDYPVVARAVRPNDPHGTLGVTANDWEPIPTSHEIGANQPTLQVYKFSIMNLSLSADEETGREHFTNTAKMIRVILYQDSSLRLSLQNLQETDSFYIERFKRLTVVRQKFVSGDLSGIWNFVGTTIFHVETELLAI